MHTNGIPFSFVCGTLLVSFIALYLSFTLKSYRNGKIIRFLLNTAFFAFLFEVVFLLPPFFSVVLSQGLSWHLISITLQGLRYLIILILIPLYTMVALCSLTASYETKLARQKSILLIKQRRQESSKKKMFFKKLQHKIWKKQISQHKQSISILELKIKHNQTKKGIPLASAIVVPICLYLTVGLIGITSAYQATDFRLIDTDQTVFSQQIMDKVNWNKENDEVTGLVELYRNEEYIIIAPCTYSESEDEITIYTTYQHTLPVENTTYRSKNFQYTNIQ